jgi:hypothetical protein
MTNMNTIVMTAFLIPWTIAAISFFYTLFNMILMSCSFKDMRNDYSKRVIWNPLNVIFRPELLTTRGLKARSRVFLGAKIFICSIPALFLVGMAGKILLRLVASPI